MEPCVQSGRGKVLVIDDEPTLVELTTVFLEKAGIEAVGFDSSTEAISWYRKHSSEIDLVILDMKMPKMDGAACFKELKRINPGAQVVILSGYIQDEAAQRLLDQGAITFFQKPLKYPELTKWVANRVGHADANLDIR